MKYSFILLGIGMIAGSAGGLAYLKLNEGVGPEEDVEMSSVAYFTSLADPASRAKPKPVEDAGEPDVDPESSLSRLSKSPYYDIRVKRMYEHANRASADRRADHIAAVDYFVAVVEGRINESANDPPFESLTLGERAAYEGEMLSMINDLAGITAE
ncbi:MAG: hypothetical protein ACPGGK_16725 [Pikeienuella sp.]